MIMRDLYNIRVKDDYKDNLEHDSRDSGDMHVRYRLEKA